MISQVGKDKNQPDSHTKTLTKVEKTDLHFPYSIVSFLADELFASSHPFEDTPLHVAAEYNPEATKLLIASNAKVNVLNRVNKSPLFLAACFNQRDSVVALCKAGADPHLGQSPLSSSQISSEMKMLIKRLL